jgi:hypothetical protein
MFLLFALSSPGFIDTAVDSKPVASAESCCSTQVRLFMTSVCLPLLVSNFFDAKFGEGAD